jgi:hypothetical protein
MELYNIIDDEEFYYNHLETEPDELIIEFDNYYQSPFEQMINDFTSECCKIIKQNMEIITESAKQSDGKTFWEKFKRFMRIVLLVLRKFVRAIKRLVTKKIPNALRRARETYRRWKHDIPRIKPEDMKIKRDWVFNGESITVEIDLEKNVIYSNILKEESYSDITYDSDGTHLSNSVERTLENYIKVMDIWLDLCDEATKDVGNLKSISEHMEKTMKSVNDYAGPYGFKLGYYNDWVRRNEKPVGIDIDEFISRFERITDEYNSVIKKADAVCDKIEKLLLRTKYKDDLIPSSSYSDDPYIGINDPEVTKRHRVAHNLKPGESDVTTDDFKIFHNFADLSQELGIHTSALVKGYEELKTEAKILTDTMNDISKPKQEAEDNG